MKKMNKILCTALVLAMSATAFASCELFNLGGTEKEKKVMNVSLNPQVEFVLDGNDKVISVNALNEEGNLIITAEAFSNVTGKTAEEAAKLFVQVSKETGYLVSGTASAGDNQISISLSGNTKDAKALYDDIKAEVDTYLDSVDVTAAINQAAAITEAKIRELVDECAPYLETAKMEYSELMDALIESRKETAEFYSQELKNAYYEAKEFAMQQAEFETLREHMNIVGQAAFDIVNGFYTTAVETIESTRMTLLVNENSPYQLALKTFREAKAEFLKARYEFTVGDADVTVEIDQATLDRLEEALNEAEEALLSAGVQANETLDGLKATATEKYDAVVAKLQELSIRANDHLDEISASWKAKQTEFFTDFETKYAEAKAAAESNWKAMEDALTDNASSEVE